MSSNKCRTCGHHHRGRCYPLCETCDRRHLGDCLPPCSICRNRHPGACRYASKEPAVEPPAPAPATPTPAVEPPAEADTVESEHEESVDFNKVDVTTLSHDELKDAYAKLLEAFNALAYVHEDAIEQILYLKEENEILSQNVGEDY